MVAKKTEPSGTPQRKLPPAMTPEAREQQLIHLAYNLAEERLRNGTASAQEVTHLLKAGQKQSELAIREAELKNDLLIARTTQIGNEDNQRQMLQDAMRAFAGYQGKDFDEDEDFDD
jgi:hypothetical protein